MDIILIGSGNTATVLGRKLELSGHRILQVYSPQENHARILAEKLNSIPVSRIYQIKKKADLVIIAIKDEVVEEFAGKLEHFDGLVVHTAGAVSINVLSRLTNHFGVLYPLQSLRKELELLPKISLLIDGNRESSRELIRKLALDIAENVFETDDTSRLKYHLSGTVVNNFTNHLFTLTAQFCERENISFAALQPLMEETVTRLRSLAPSETQTGPAWRNDLHTLDKHVELLDQYPALLSIYNLFTKEIRDTRISGESGISIRT